MSGELRKNKEITPGDRRQRRANAKLTKEANQYCIRLCTQFLKEVKSKGFTFANEEVAEIFNKYDNQWIRWITCRVAKGKLSVQTKEMFTNYLKAFTSSQPTNKTADDN